MVHCSAFGIHLEKQNPAGGTVVFCSAFSYDIHWWWCDAFILDMKTKTQRTAKPGARSHPEKGQNKFDSGGAAVVLLVANQQKPSSPSS